MINLLTSIKSKALKSVISGFKLYFLTQRLQAIYLTSLTLSFPIYRRVNEEDTIK